MKEEKKILIIDNDQEVIDSIVVSLFYINYKVDYSSDVDESLKLFWENLYWIVIINLDSNIKNIDKFFEETNHASVGVVYILLNDEGVLHNVSKFPEHGIFLFLPKPIDSSKLVKKVEFAYQIMQSQKATKQKDREKNLSVSGKDIIREMKQTISNNMETIKDNSLFHTLKNVFTQGSGFGMLITLISYIEDGSTVTEDGYIVDKEIGDMLIYHSKFAYKTVDLIDKLHNVTKNKIRLYQVRADTIPKLVDKAIEKLNSRIPVKGHKISLGLNSELKNYHLNINEELIESAIFEILLNALKYSVENTTIMVTYNHVSDYITISISNTPEAKFKSDQLNNWFLPFYREQQIVDERYESLDFGLGLTYVQKIIQQHNGKIFLDKINVHLFGGKKMLNVSISLPIF
ncbi:MAG: hypothetical protein H7A23_03880 [Leptospiraceae bacterium]|nr:hypothetical protein [Leptospiraceae bacterium]MCP5493671.1 hypothetical protein [Leptospiraceae bacterium]